MRFATVAAPAAALVQENGVGLVLRIQMKNPLKIIMGCLALGPGCLYPQIKSYLNRFSTYLTVQRLSHIDHGLSIASRLRTTHGYADEALNFALYNSQFYITMHPFWFFVLYYVFIKLTFPFEHITVSHSPAVLTEARLKIRGLLQEPVVGGVIVGGVINHGQRISVIN